MSHRERRNGVFAGVLLICLALFLSVFIRTCFSSFEKAAPVETEERESVSVTPVAALPPPEEPLPPPKASEIPPLRTEEPVPPPPASLVAASVTPASPEPPRLLEPFVLALEETSEEEDPFADFFIAGEDDSSALYEDGIYYLALYVNDEYVGDIETKFVEERKLINMKEFYRYVGDMLTEESGERIFGDCGDYLSLEELRGRGVDITFDSAAFALYAKIAYSDFSLRVLSVTRIPASKREKYMLSGALDLKAAKFSWVASMSLYGSITYPATFSGVTSQSSSMYVNNSLAFGQIGLDFSFSLASSPPHFTLGTWVAFHDFLESNTRLTFGSVGSNLSVRTPPTIDTNIGFSLEKSYSYGAGTALGNQFQHTIDITEPSTVDIYLNPDETENAENTKTFTRRLQAGTYRLKDFVFTQGANRIKIVVTPEGREDEPVVTYVDTSYDTRLLGKGDSLYGFSLSMPRGNDPSAPGGLFHFKDPLRRSWLSYYPQYFTARYWQSVGLLDTLTFAVDLSATPGVFSGTFRGLWANEIGTTTMQMTMKLAENYRDPLFSASLTEKFNNNVMRDHGSLSLSLSASSFSRGKPFLNPSTGTLSTAPSVVGSLVGSLSFSSVGLLTKLRYGISGSLSSVWGNVYPTWNATFTTSLTPTRGLSLSASMTVGRNDAGGRGKVNVTATISGSYSFGSTANVSTSTTGGSRARTTSGFGLSWRPTGEDSLSLSLSSLKWKTPKDLSLLASWSHTGKVSSLSLRQQFSGSSESMTTSMNFSTSFAFADGVFGMGRSVGNTYLLVKPEGELKKSPIAVARSMDSSPRILKKHFGSALFSSISPYVRNNVVVYGGGGDFQTTSSFMYQFTPRARQAYVARIDLPPTYTVSGILRHADGSFYEQYSSPVYRLSHDEEGGEILLQDDELYLFTDQEGRFILSSVSPGDYSFDLQVSPDVWIAVKFTVPVMEDRALRVLEFEDLHDDGPYDEGGFDDYNATMTLKRKALIDEETFYAMLFPPVGETGDQE